MTSQYGDYGGPEGDAQEPVSADTGGEEAAPAPEPTIQDLMRELAALRTDVQYTDRRVQAWSDRNQNALATLADSTRTALQGLYQRVADLSDAGVDTSGMLADLYDQTVDPDTKERKALERRIKQAERAAEQATRAAQAPPPQPMAPAPTQPQRDPSWNDWKQHEADLVKHANLRGFTHEDMADQKAWMARLYGAGLAPDGYRTAWEYKAAISTAIDNLAASRRQQQRQRTETPNVTTAGRGARNYRDVDVRSVPNEEFENNFADIAAAVVAKNRR